jgi:hypothetical protein
LLLAHWRGQIGLGRIVGGVLIGVALVLAVFGAEELATGGHMSQAIFLAAAQATRVHPANWFRTQVVLLAVLAQNAGLITLLTAASLAMVSLRGKLFRTILVVLGSMVVGVIAVQAILQLVIRITWRAEFAWLTDMAAAVNFVVPLAGIAAVILVLPLGACLVPRSLVRGPLDKLLCLYLAGELAMLGVLCASSTGAWVNYAIPTAIIAAVLTGRALDRALAEVASPRRVLLIVLAASALPIGAALEPYLKEQRRLIERTAIARIFQELGRPPTECFFVGRPGDNRVYGQLGLVYDDWLYPVFESIRLAEPRSSWLRAALVNDPIRFIVTTSDSPEIDGVGRSLRQLGYTSRIQVGPFYVWERVRAGLSRELAPSRAPTP